MSDALYFAALIMFLVAVSGLIGVLLPKRRKRLYWTRQDVLTTRLHERRM